MTRLVLVSLYPGLTHPQGDHGNVLALARRARLRGHDVETVVLAPADPIPKAAVLLLGGSEHEDQPALARHLRDGDRLRRAWAAGAVVFGSGAGFQVLGTAFEGLDGLFHEGVGLVDARTTLGTEVNLPAVTAPNPALGLPAMAGYESHLGRTTLGPGVMPLATLDLGTGNGAPGTDDAARTDAAAVDGAIGERIVGTYLHGPVLAWNPELADLLLAMALGDPPEPAPPGFAAEVRAARIAEARRVHAARRGAAG
jgi:CobQ-like glutamine amidotransferase family enzyme